MSRPTVELATEQVVAYIWEGIEKGELQRGNRLPPERELAGLIGVSRPSVRAGLRALAAYLPVNRTPDGTVFSW